MKENNPKRLIYTNYALMAIISSIILFVSSTGEILSDLLRYPLLDGLCLLAFIVLGYLIGASPRKKFNNILLFIFYFLLFNCFNDGHGAGWSHTTEIGDKFGIMIINTVILLVTIIVPAVFFLIAFTQDYFIKNAFHNIQDNNIEEEL